jgi:starch phosphorylase
MAYTNHTLLPEALEQWPLRMFERLLPRLLDIIYEINARFLAQVAQRWPGDSERQRRMSIIAEGEEPMVRMAYLAIAGSFSVNGVAELHSKLLQRGLFRDFYELWPQKFNNKTNGVTQRRWLAWANPELSALLDETLGEQWRTDLAIMSGLAPLATDASFQERWRAVRSARKQLLASYVESHSGVGFDPDAMFDVQVKRIHEYKRQLLNVLHLIHLYCRIKNGDTAGLVPRCALLAGKAAPGYAIAKLIIKLISNVATVINSDHAVNPYVSAAFLPDYRVSAMEVVATGTDLSEQISTAGKEASGTGNMKMMMNGAVTIGTLDGANIEILEQVGEDNFFLFGLTADQVETRRANYDPNGIIAADDGLSEVMRLLQQGHFNQFEPGIFKPIIDSIRNPGDPWLVAADFRSYVEAQERATAAWTDMTDWTRMSILNSAGSGRFSTDRTMVEYNRDIWKLTPVAAAPESESAGSTATSKRTSG